MAFKNWAANKSELARRAYFQLKKVSVIAVRKAKEESRKTFGVEMESSHWNANKIF